MPADRSATSGSQRQTGSTMTAGGLSYPSAAAKTATSLQPGDKSVEATSSAPILSDRRLFVGNLAPAVTEYDLLVLFQPHGKLTKLDIVFHRQGPERGKPKGFAFVELGTPEQATRARLSVDGKLVKGREIRVRYATVADNGDASEGGATRGATRPGAQRRPLQAGGLERIGRNAGASSNRGKAKPPASVDDRIAAMEAKLTAMKRAKEQRDSSPHVTEESSAGSGQLRAHPSLPAKPAGKLPNR